MVKMIVLPRQARDKHRKPQEEMRVLIGHASWIPAFAGPELWTWLLGHSKAAVTSG
jgi:hypothetical protein